MAVTAQRWWIALGSIPYRELLNTPGIARAHDLQRLVSYSLGVVVALVIELPGWRTAPVLVIAAVLLIATVERLVSGRTVAPYLLAQVDQLLSTLAIAIATGSPLITIAVVIFITGAIVASFAAPRRVAVAGALLTGVPGFGTALAISSRPGTGVTNYLAALVLVLLMVALAMFILVFFTLQARQLRRELQSREVQLNAVLEVTPVVLATVGRNGTITMLAGDLPAWAGLSGRQIVRGSELENVVTRAAAGQRVTAEVGLDGSTFTVTCELGTDGSVLLTASDVTEQTETRVRLEDLVRSKDQFIAAVSHELRTPLSSVLGFAELVQDEMDDDDPLRQMMGEVADQSAEMAAIIDDLLVAARSSFEEVPTAPRAIDLAAEAAAVVDAVGPRLVTRPVCSVATTPAYADPIRVRQIIRNLLTNADRYGGDHIALRTHGTAAESILEVRDSGAPLQPDLRDRIFEPYESSGPVKGQPAAIGLGLAVSRTLAHLMGGSLVYRHDGQCSVFELRLPARPVLQPEGSAPMRRTWRSRSPDSLRD